MVDLKDYAENDNKGFDHCVYCNTYYSFGWKQRAEKAEAQVTRLQEALRRIAHADWDRGSVEWRDSINEAHKMLAATEPEEPT